MNVCHIISGDIWAGAEVQAYSIINELSRIPTFNMQVITFNNGILSSKIAAQGIRLDIVNEANLNVFPMILKIYKLLKNEKIDILHVHGYKENFIGGVAAKLLKSKVIRTHHGKGMIESSLFHSLIEKINEKLLTSKLISVSNDLKRFLLSNNFKANKISVVRNGIDAALICPSRSKTEIRDQLHIEPGNIVIGTLGRLVSVKGHKYLLEAIKLVLEKDNRVVFAVAGNGPLFEDMVRSAMTLGVEKKIRFIGFTDDPISFLNAFDIFILTSLDEGIPISLLEAMCLQKPIISTAVGGIPEIINNGHNGLLIPERDSMAIADACLKLMSNKDYGSQLAHSAFNDVSEKYSLRSMVAETTKLYKELLVG
jgi:L-malate glycosyltransferase